MESFYGKWKVDLGKTVGVKEIGKLLGWPEDKQNMFASLEYTLLLEVTGDKNRSFVDYGPIKLEFLFKLGEPFDYSGADGTKAKCTVRLQDGKLIENYTNDGGAKWQTERTVSGTNMKAITTFDGQPSVKCVQELNKI